MDVKLCRVVIAAATMVSLAAAAVSAQERATTLPAAAVPPTTRPVQPYGQIKKWFDELASPEPQAREDARTQLLGLSQPELLTLREVIRRGVSLAPSQSAVLHDIVAHCYLASMKDESNPHGFLGVQLDPPDNGVQENLQASGAGVYIFDCMPGYCGYRWLRRADVIGGVFAEGELVRIQRKDQLIAYVSNTLPGTALKLQVLRQGRVMEVTLKIDARPVIAEEEPLRVEEWKTKRLEEADDYWKREFVPLLGGMT